MELSSSNIKKILIIPGMEPCASHPKPRDIDPEKNSLYFCKWNFLALISKKVSYFLKSKLFLYFLKRKLFLYFLKRKLFSYFFK